MSQSISVISEKRTIVLKNSGFLEKKVGNISWLFFFPKTKPNKISIFITFVTIFQPSLSQILTSLPNMTTKDKQLGCSLERRAYD